MTSVNISAVTNSVVVTQGDTTLVTVTTAGPQGIPGATGSTGSTGPQGPPGAAGPPKSVTIAPPQVNDQFTLFYTQYATTLTQVLAIVRGTTPSVTFELRYGTDRSAAGTLAVVPETVTNTTTGEPIAIQNMPIPANNFFWVVVTAVSGQVEEFSVSVEV